MNDPKHTPEPWQGYGPNIEGGTSVTFRTVARVNVRGEQWSDEERANRDRIVACVNGCAGIADPSAVPLMVEALRRAVIVLEEYVFSDTSPEMCSMAEALAGAEDVLAKTEGR